MASSTKVSGHRAATSSWRDSARPPLRTRISSSSKVLGASAIGCPSRVTTWRATSTRTGPNAYTSPPGGRPTASDGRLRISWATCAPPNDVLTNRVGARGARRTADRCVVRRIVLSFGRAEPFCRHSSRVRRSWPCTGTITVHRRVMNRSNVSRPSAWLTGCRDRNAMSVPSALMVG